VENKMDKIVNWYEEGLDKIYDNDNNGYTFGIYYYDGDTILDVEWFKSEDERDRIYYG
jgi:hypothetical protein